MKRCCAQTRDAATDVPAAAQDLWVDLNFVGTHVHISYRINARIEFMSINSCSPVRWDTSRVSKRACSRLMRCTFCKLHPARRPARRHISNTRTTLLLACRLDERHREARAAWHTASTKAHPVSACERDPSNQETCRAIPLLKVRL